MKNTLLLAAFIFWNRSTAQKAAAVPGEYYLTGVMETASGFKLDPDSTFQFFFSYGALDRAGSGRWKLDGDNLSFTSKPRPPLDFFLLKSSTVPGNTITVKMTSGNKNILRYVQCLLKTAEGEFKGIADEEGIIQFPKSAVQSLSLLFQLRPDRYSRFTPRLAGANYFEFRFEPWIAEVFFENFRLKIDSGELVGTHPLMKGAQYRYEKRP